MAQASKTQEKRAANKNDRIDLTIYMATTPRENLPRGVANKWSADLMPPGSREEADLRKFMENPSDPNNKFVLFFEDEKKAIEYARALDSLLAKTGVLSNVVITVSKKSARDEEEYTLAPGQNYKISLAAKERKWVPPLNGREAAVLKKFRAAGESLTSVVPAKRPSADEGLVASAKGALRSDDPLFGAGTGGGDLDLVPNKKYEEAGVARIVENPFRASYVASNGNTVPIFESEEQRQEAWNELQRSGKCTFTLSKRPGRKVYGNPKFILKGMPKNMENLQVSVNRAEGGKYQVTVTGTRKITHEDVMDRACGKG
ncbi:MAG: hypothetical protein QXH30_01630 [Candidatus Bilamarchaeaceae archaeon]